MNSIAEKFVKLVLKVGLYDQAVVDAYHGPDEWKPAELSEEQKKNYPLNDFIKEVEELKKNLNDIESAELTGEEKMRKNFLSKQFIALKAKIEMIGGKKYKFDEESQMLYDGVAPHLKQEHFAEILTELDNLLPGKGDVAKRFEEYRNQFVIPIEKLDTVFMTAIEEGRKRTLKYIPLPEKENFTVEYVKDKPWGAYNWYKGNSFSVIQVNTDLPVYIDRAVDLGCHEGYPGHHVYNLLLERNLLKGKGWMEFSIYPLFSPTSLIAEGTANYGIKVAFPGEERIEYEKNVLFPLAGLDGAKADEYYKILNLFEQLNFARNEASRKYYDGEFTKEELQSWLVKYCLYTPDRAAKSVDFIDTYGSYVINYNYGQQLVKEYIESRGGTKDNPDKRWEIFTDLISKPYTPSDLKN
ncbi:MAG: hypothetical protein OQJ81_05195 [Melioribacteraceae bacterium]|nr:hypothetical protein [Melioribacteraceae bacterium]